MTTLTKSDKLEIINSRSRQLEYRKYGLELDLVIENSKSEPDTVAVNDLTSKISEIDAQIAALGIELTAVNALTE